MKLFAFMIHSQIHAIIYYGTVEEVNKKKAKNKAVRSYCENNPGCRITTVKLMEVNPDTCRNFIEANFNIDKEPS